MPPNFPDAEEEAIIAALETLAGHWDGSIPVQPQWIARVMGIEVIYEDLDSDVSGKIERKEGRSRLHVSGSHREVRQRFTLAHELGHFVRMRDAGFERLKYRSGRSERETSEDEAFADTFAAQLLMPEAAVRELFETGAEVAQMARELKVSRGAMVRRLRELGWHR